eukprot:CAMPEP_0168251954 /NCGR_PEP_ID=MMETSP0141_2-20121125/3358_1 /TAXON_ID=44445 /ORGANISM="Pseudo-nitzschia australis, Strain 10249 10 AB" /LENGTH=634 /DNA_ID=CAMNT_0008188145 /DNA_START=11 /DNA_END=1912 /DNA_ORIENTATION=-
MEAYSNHSQSYDPAYDTVETETVEAAPEDHYQRLGRISSPCVSMSVRIGKDDGCTNRACKHINCPPSLIPESSSSTTTSSLQKSTRKNNSSISNKIIQDAANNCIKNNFDEETFASAKSIALKFANPCGLDMNRYHYNHQGEQPATPMTPSTVGSSFSEDSHGGESIETYSTPAHSTNLKRNPESKCDDDCNGVLFTEGLVMKRRSRGNGEGFPAFSVDKDNEGCRPLIPARNTNFELGIDEMVILVGDQEYPLPRTSKNFASKYFWSQRKRVDDHFSYVDLSTHSPDEFDAVMEFFENKRAMDAWENIHWNNLPIILPWFVEFQALPLVSAADTFLLHHALRTGGRGFGGGDNGTSKSNRPIGLSNLLTLTRIAFRCGLEGTKINARKLLKQSLLEPRKYTSEFDDSFNSNRPALEVAVEDIELEWTLKDLRTLAQILQTYGELREFLWDTAVIVYLPHDLDISNSMGLVSNDLFPYLLREGMMQMMIVEGIRIESSYDPMNTFANDYNFVGPEGIGFSYSESTSCSDTTIPTNPSAQWHKLTDDEMQDCLHDIVKYLNKFRAEKVARTAMYKEQQENSLVASESLSYDIGESSVDGAPNSRPRRGRGSSTDNYASDRVEGRTLTSSQRREIA